MHLRKFYILTLFLKLYFFLYTPYAISSPSKASFKLPKKCGHLVIWSFGHFDVFKENEKGTEGKKEKKEKKKKVNIKKLKL